MMMMMMMMMMTLYSTTFLPSKPCHPHVLALSYTL